MRSEYSMRVSNTVVTKYSNHLNIVKLRVLSHVLVNSCITPGQVYETSREDPEMGFVNHHHQTTFFELKREGQMVVEGEV